MSGSCIKGEGGGVGGVCKYEERGFWGVDRLDNLGTLCASRIVTGTVFRRPPQAIAIVMTIRRRMIVGVSNFDQFFVKLPIKFIQ